ncbi:adenine phosphoribosyltransferase [Actinokineospora sp. UTMC 2448]|uniref:adenine phosphoribosyltransferase n=1 Tax=Actinokineospora sp. UTMC 2448 TaxID=2268449 RepID=UPI002164101A|nr:adenine phosphoribosyltransferase [Actinokineospora sp. UTMC 2448]UVS78248.1 Adenine phosphoribosyltransferase [Actinokineospora sp. UTMC 2448]
MTEALTRALALIREVPDFPEPGVLFRDLTPMLADGPALRAVAEALGADLDPEVTTVVAVEARGFLFGAALAAVHGLGVVPVRKAGKLPLVADRQTYELEYGTATLELPDGGLRLAEKVIVVDDVLATGGTLAAACDLVERAGARVAATRVVVEIAALAGRERLSGRDTGALLTV